MGIDSRRARDEVVCNYGAFGRRFHFDLVFIHLEVASSNHNGTSVDLDRGNALISAVPLAEFTVAEADGPISGNSRDLLAWSPEGAVTEAYGAVILFFDNDFRRIFALHCDEFAVRNQ